MDELPYFDLPNHLHLSDKDKTEPLDSEKQQTTYQNIKIASSVFLKYHVINIDIRKKSLLNKLL